VSVSGTSRGSGATGWADERWSAVEHRPPQPDRAELDEAVGARYAAAEPDHGRRAEQLIAAGDVEFDAVAADIEEP